MGAETKNSIKELRIAAGLTQEKVALDNGCDTQTICRYETGKRDPSLAMALRLAAYFKVSTDDVFKLPEKR